MPFKRQKLLNVDNIRIDGNSILSTNANGDIILIPDGTGRVLYQSSEVLTTASIITTATNLQAGTAGQLVYQSAPGVTSFAGPGSAGQLLVSQGTSAPSYANTTSIYVGTSVSAEKLLTVRTISLDGDLSGTVNFDGSTNVTLTATITADSVTLGTDTTGNYVQSGATSGFGLSGSATTEGSTFTVTANSTSSNTTDTIVFRDGSGNFSAATITADLTGIATTATNLQNGAAGQIPIQSSVGVTTFIPTGTAGQFLKAGTNSASFVNTSTIYVDSAVKAERWIAPRTFTFGGDLSGSMVVDGSQDVTFTATVVTDAVALGTDTTGIYVASGATSGFGISGSATTEGSTFTVSVNSTSSNAVNTIVFRDPKGDISVNTLTVYGDILPAVNNTLNLGSTSSRFKSVFVGANSIDIDGVVINASAGGLQVDGRLSVLSTSSNTGTSASNSFYTAGGAWVDKDLIVEGSAIFKGITVFQGTASYVLSTETVYTDNLINLHVPPDWQVGQHDWTLDDGRDVGLIFHYYKSQDKNAFLGLANDSGYLEFYSDGNESGGVFTGTSYGTFKTANIELTGADAASNTATGALRVMGGVGIGGSTYVGGTLNVTGNTTLTGDLAVNGGDITSSAATFNLVNSNVTTLNLAGAGTAITVGATSGYTAVRNQFTVTDTTAASSTSTGALRVLGGVGIAGKVYAGDNVTAPLFIGDLRGNADTATTGTHLSGGLAGQIAIQSAPGRTAFIPVGTSGQFLQAGTNTATFVSTSSMYVNTAVRAERWLTARTFTFGGDLTGSMSVDGSQDVTFTATIAANSVALGTDTTGDYVSNGATSGFGLSGSTTGENQTFTVTANSTSANTISTIVYRDASGNFSAGTITAALTGNVTGNITGNLTGTATTATNIAGGAAGSIPYQSAAGATSMLSIGTNGYVLTSNGATPQWTLATGLSAGTAQTATNIAGGTAGQIVYQIGPTNTGFAGPGTAGQILVSGGTSGPSFASTGTFYIGNAVNAEKLSTPRTFTLGGDLTGNLTFDGSQDVTFTATIAANSVALGTDTTGDYVSNGATSGFGISGSTTGESQTFTVTANSTSANTLSTIVFRDASGNFSAGTITGNLTGTATTATNIAGGAANRIPFQTSAGVTSFVVAPQTATTFLSWSGSAFYWSDEGLSQSWEVKTAAYTAVAGDKIIAVNTTGTFTIYLPASPVVGNFVQITDGGRFSQTSTYVSANGGTIEGSTDDVQLDITGVTAEFIYDGSTWQVVATAGPKGPSGPTGPTVSLTAVSSHILPSTDVTYDLGSTSTRWRSLYVSTNTIYIGDYALGISTSGQVTVQNTLVPGSQPTAVVGPQGPQGPSGPSGAGSYARVFGFSLVFGG